MYKTILVPLDGSERAEMALPYAAGLSSNLNCDLHLLYVSPPKDPCAYAARYYINQISRNTGKGFLLPSKVTPVFLDGAAAFTITNYAAQHNIDLIIMASHGLTGATQWPLGGIVDRVISTTEKPLLLIRVKSSPMIWQHKAPYRILIPLDGSKLAEAAVSRIRGLIMDQLIPPRSVEIMLFHATSPLRECCSYWTFSIAGEESDEGFDKFAHREGITSPLAGAEVYTQRELADINARVASYLAEVGTKLSSEGFKVSSKITTGPPSKEIVTFADKTNVDLVAMSTHGRSGYNRLFLGSVSDRTIRMGSKPLLLVRDRPES